MTTYNATTNKVYCGCFAGSLDEFSEQVGKTHGETKHGKDYKNLIEYFKVLKSSIETKVENKEKT